MVVLRSCTTYRCARPLSGRVPSSESRWQPAQPRQTVAVSQGASVKVVCCVSYSSCSCLPYSRLWVRCEECRGELERCSEKIPFSNYLCLFRRSDFQLYYLYDQASRDTFILAPQNECTPT